MCSSFLWVWKVFCCSGYLVGHHLTQATFFHWDVMSERLFCGWEVENCRFLQLVAVSQSRGNLLWVLVHSAEETALVTAEVPSGSDVDSRGLPRLEALVSLLFAAPHFYVFKTFVLKCQFLGLAKYIKYLKNLQLFSFSLQNLCFLVSSSMTATMY